MKCLVEPPACQNRGRSHGGDMSTMKKIWGVVKIAVIAQRGAGQPLQMRLRERLRRLYKVGCFCLRQTKSLKVFFGGGSRLTKGLEAVKFSSGVFKFYNVHKFSLKCSIFKSFGGKVFDVAAYEGCVLSFVARVVGPRTYCLGVEVLVPNYIQPSSPPAPAPKNAGKRKESPCSQEGQVKTDILLMGTSNMDLDCSSNNTNDPTHLLIPHHKPGTVLGPSHVLSSLTCLATKMVG